jgi:ankyrin repeat protein
VLPDAAAARPHAGCLPISFSVALDTTATNNDGDDTVLHIAMWVWSTEVVSKLLEIPMDVFRGGRIHGDDVAIR